jgi:hypothetical protein
VRREGREAKWDWRDRDRLQSFRMRVVRVGGKVPGGGGERLGLEARFREVRAEKAEKEEEERLPRRLLLGRERDWTVSDAVQETPCLRACASARGSE